MKVGIPAEVKNHEYRVAITPAGVHELVERGHEVIIETGAGVGSSFADMDFKAAGAQILATADEVWGQADLLLKVKEPIAEEYHRLRKGQVLFTYLHLAASKQCTDALLASGTTSIAYETVTAPDGTLPLLAPMSEVAGRLAPQAGAYHLMARRGQRRPDGRCPGCASGEGRRHRCGRVRQERHRDRARHARRRHRPRPVHRSPARDRRSLPWPGQDRRVEQPRTRAGRARRRPGDRCRAGAGREGPEVGRQPASLRG